MVTSSEARDPEWMLERCGAGQKSARSYTNTNGSPSANSALTIQPAIFSISAANVSRSLWELDRI